MQSGCNRRLAAHFSLCLASLLLFQPGLSARPDIDNQPVKGRGGGNRQLLLSQGQEEAAGLPSPEYIQRRGLGRRRWPVENVPSGRAAGDETRFGQGQDLRAGDPGGLRLPVPPPSGLDQRRRSGAFVSGGGAGRFRRRVGAMGGAPMFGGPLDLTLLGLSEEQKGRIREIRRQSAGKARELRRVLRDRRAEMRDLLFDPSAADAQIRAKRQELRQMQDQLEEVILSDFLALRAVLTPEQRQRLPEIKPLARRPFAGRWRNFAGRPGAGPDGEALPPAPASEPRFGGP